MPATSNLARSPGRQRDPLKRAAIIEAAMKLFLEDGFGMVSMEAVAAAASVSKMTLYKNFPDKEVLLEECVKHITMGMVGELFRTQAAGGTLAEGLCALGRAFLARVCRAETVAAERSLPISLVNNPQLAKRFYDAGPARMLQSVADTLSNAHNRGELLIEDPMEAADDLLALWKGDLQKRMMLGLEKPPTANQIAERINRKTAIFLLAYRRQ